MVFRIDLSDVRRSRSEYRVMQPQDGMKNYEFKSFLSPAVIEDCGDAVRDRPSPRVSIENTVGENNDEESSQH